MAVVGTNILKNFSAVSATSFTTASFTPSASTLYLATFTSRTGITADPTQPTCTGAGLTWVVVGSVAFDNSSSSRRRVTVFRAMGTGSAGGLTFDEAGQTQTSGTWSIDSFTGVDTSGTNGSGAIVQTVTAFDPAGTNTSLSATLAAFSSVSNATFGGCGFGNPPNASTAGTGFSKLGDVEDGATGVRTTTEFRNDNSTSVGISYAGAGEIGIIAAEIKALATTTNSNNFFRML